MRILAVVSIKDLLARVDVFELSSTNGISLSLSPSPFIPRLLLLKLVSKAVTQLDLSLK